MQAETLAEHIKFDHGYTVASPPIRNVSSLSESVMGVQYKAYVACLNDIIVPFSAS